TTLAKRHGPGIRVNAIAPGFFVGEQNRSLLFEPDGTLTPRGRTIIDDTPMGRFGEAEELLGALLWLLSDASRFVTGVVVPVDGGFSAFSGVEPTRSAGSGRLLSPPPPRASPARSARASRGSSGRCPSR